MTTQEFRETGRRIADRVARWLEVILLSLSTGLLSIVVYYYGDMPKRMDMLTTSVELLSLKVTYLQMDITELKESQRVSQNWREQQATLAAKVERHAEQLKDHERRINDWEKPFPWSKTGNKK